MPAIKKPSFITPNRFLSLAFLLGVVEFTAAGIVILNIERDPKNIVALGLSAQRLLLLGFTTLTTVACLGTALTLWLRPNLTNRLVSFLSSHLQVKRFYIFSLTFLCMVGWLSFTCPPYLFQDAKYIFTRLQPILAVVGAISAQLLLWVISVTIPNKWVRLRELFSSSRSTYQLAGWILVGFFLIWGILAFTGIGFTPDDRFWNVAGIPLGGLQFFASILILIVLIFLGSPGIGVVGFRNWGSNGAYAPFDPQLRTSSQQLPMNHKSANRWFEILTCVALYGSAGLLWNATELKQHYFSPSPVAPHYQPYPASDALIYDASAHFLINGYGIFSSGYTDKPLYIVFLGLLHTIAGENYWLLTALQVWVLALIPPLIYLVGRSIHSPILGFYIALLVLLRQRNSIAASHLIASVNPKLLVTEVFMLLGLILCAWLIVRWLKTSPTRSGNWAALVGGIIGMMSLIRLNAILLLPAAILFSLLNYRSSLKTWWNHSARLTLAFLLVFVPVVLTGTGPDGIPLLIIKFKEVIRTRYLPENSFYLPSAPFASAANPQIHQAPIEKDTSPWDFVPAHFAHNLVGSLLALPNSLVYDDLPTLAQRPYWTEGSGWTGQLPTGQIVWTAVNIGLIALGLAKSWEKHRSAGLVPLVIYLVYDLALSLGRTSGSRYLVPIDWVVYFYFAIGIVEFISLLPKVLHSNPESAWLKSETVTVTSATSLRHAWLIFVPFAFFGGLMHVLDDYLPQRFQSIADSDPVALLQKFLPTETGDETKVSVYSGQVLYPRMNQSDSGQPYLDFYILSPQQGVINIHLTRVNGIDEFPSGSFAAVAGCPLPNTRSNYPILINANLVVISEPDRSTPIFPQPNPDRFNCW